MEDRRSPTAFDIKFAFNKWTLGEDFCTRVLGFDAEAALDDFVFDMLADLASPRRSGRGGQHLLLRRHDLEGAPGLKDEHLPVFDCANPCGRIGKRYRCPGRATSA